MKSLISIQDFSKEEILHVLEVAKEFEKDRSRKILEGKVVGSLFFEPSTRTRLSFETAVNRLGARVIGFSDATNTSVSKGETLKDTIKMVSNYVDLIVMRHPLEGSSRYASEVASVPVINAGDGANQHPSQTLLDLYTIMQTQGRLEGLTINMVGDLKYGRTTHSLLQAMSHFSPEFIFTAPEELKMPAVYKSFLDSKGIPYRETTSLEEHLNDCDILYMTRVQQERFNDLMEYESYWKNFENYTNVPDLTWFDCFTVQRFYFDDFYFVYFGKLNYYDDVDFLAYLEEVSDAKIVYDVQKMYSHYSEYYLRGSLYNHPGFLPLYEKEKPFKVILTLDGDYMKMYIDEVSEENLFQILVRTTPEACDQIEKWIKGESYDLSKVVMPRSSSVGKTMTVSENLRLRSGEATTSDVVTVLQAEAPFGRSHNIRCCHCAAGRHPCKNP